MTQEQDMTFEFEMTERAKLALSHEEGEIIGRAEYSTSEPSYLVRYVSADGQQRESWFAESALRKL